MLNRRRNQQSSNYSESYFSENSEKNRFLLSIIHIFFIFLKIKKFLFK